jgi:putative intracellular protease/amidase
VNDLSRTNILIIIPKSQFCEQELNGVRTILQQSGANVVVLSKTGKEGRGMNKEKFRPDGMIVDWNKQNLAASKYHAVILVGGKGAKKSLWDDPIVPLILIDHYRFGSVVGAIGEALVVLQKASLIVGDVPLPKDESTREELERLNVACVDIPVIRGENLVLGQGVNSVSEFSQSIVDCIKSMRVK